MSFSAVPESRVVSLERYRFERNSQAQLPLKLGDPAFLRPLLGTSPRLSSSPLTIERITHRRRMLAHLEAARAHAVGRLG